MKKIQKIFIGMLAVVSLAAAGNASAIDLDTSSTTITKLDCTQLANDITIILTSGVVGSVDCTSNANDYIGMSVCHTSGLKTSRTEAESTVPDVNDPSIPTCPSFGSLTDVGGVQKCVGVVEGSAFPTATTAQGTVTSRYPGSDCSVGTAGTEATASVQ
jgi:hypothetical protein